MPLVEVEQGSAEWLQMRVGMVTGSRVCDVMAKLSRKDGEAAARQNYKSDLVCEILTGRSAQHFVTPAMQWGIDNEIFARNAYELDYSPVDSAGFAFHPKITRFGASPDGLVGDDGLVEIKCPNTVTHINYILNQKVPSEYEWQMLAEMACAERQWCDFVSYDPRLPRRLQLFIKRFERDEARILEMETEVEKFMGDVDALISILNASGKVVANVG